MSLSPCRRSLNRRLANCSSRVALSEEPRLDGANGVAYGGPKKQRKRYGPESPPPLALLRRISLDLCLIHHASDILKDFNSAALAEIGSILERLRAAPSQKIPAESSITFSCQTGEGLPAGPIYKVFEVL